METLVLIVFFLASAAYLVQLSFMNKIFPWVWTLMQMIFIYLMHSKAIEQSFSLFEQYLADINLINDFMVIQIVEALLGLLLAIYMISSYHGEKRPNYLKLAQYIPGVLIFPVLFFISSILYIKFPVFEFTTMAVIQAVVIPLLFFGICKMIQSLIPELDFRLELKFFIHIMQLLAAIIISIQYLNTPVSLMAHFNGVGYVTLALVFIVAVGVIALGILFYQFKMVRLIKKQNNGRNN